MEEQKKDLHRAKIIQISGSEKRDPRAKRHPGQRKRKDSARTGDVAFLSPFHSHGPLHMLHFENYLGGDLR